MSTMRFETPSTIACSLDEGDNEYLYDFRSDTCTTPSPEMLQVMANINPKTNKYTEGIGDAVYRDDPTVLRLEKEAAKMLGKEAALFCTTGTMANLIAIMTHCPRGNEYICGQNAHVFRWEAGGAAVLGSVVPQPVEHDSDGSPNMEMIKRSVKVDDFHFAITRMIAVENPIGGSVWSLEKMKRIKEFAVEKNLAVHLDGARIFNGAEALGVPVSEMAKYADSVMFCISKGLCCPVGSLLVGSNAFIHQAKRHWKMLGGGWRQAGVLASAGLYALDNMVQRLAFDHSQAKRFAVELTSILERYHIKNAINLENVQTNMVMVDIPADIDPESLKSFLWKRNIKSHSMTPLRFVFHKDNSSESAVDYLLECIDAYFKKSQ